MSNGNTRSHEAVQEEFIGSDGGNNDSNTAAQSTSNGIDNGIVTDTINGLPPPPIPPPPPPPSVAPPTSSRGGTYISPSSSASMSEQSSGNTRKQGIDTAPLPPHSVLHPQHDTTTNSPSAGVSTVPVGSASVDHRRTLSSDVSELAPPVKPTHPFFNSSYFEDSDLASDGSIVFNAPSPDAQSTFQSQISPHGHPTTLRRDRFPSFDSVGSSNSIRYVTPTMQLPRHQPTNSGSMTSIPSAASNPRILPYNERRKLMQQQQQQQQQQRPEREPPTPAGRPSRADRAGSGAVDPYVVVSQHAPVDLGYYHQQPPTLHPNHLATMQPNPQILQQHHRIPSPHQGMPPYPQSQQHQIIPQHHYPIHPTSQHYVPHHHPHHMFPFLGVPPPTGPYSMAHQHHHQVTMDMYQQQQQQYALQVSMGQQQQQRASVAQTVGTTRPVPTRHQTRSPDVLSRPPTPDNKEAQRGSRLNGSGITQHQQLPPQPPPSSRPPVQPPPTTSISGVQSSSFDSSECDREVGPPRPQRRKDIPPPPPPPPPPAGTYAHARGDSMGSVSSLGSLEWSARYDETSDFHQKPKSRSRSGANARHPDYPNVSEFRRKNQAFLSSVERQSTLTHSPLQRNRRPPLASMDRPPPSRGGHRRLHSIDNDNWEDEKTSSKKDQDNRHKHKREDDNESSSNLSSSDLSDDEAGWEHSRRESTETSERARLLPPSGISSNEYQEQRDQRTRSNREQKSRRGQSRGLDRKVTDSYRTEQVTLEHQDEGKRKKKKKQRHRSSRHMQQDSDISEASISSSSITSREYRRWARKRAKLLERERVKFLKQWKAEEEAARIQAENNRWHRRLGRSIVSKCTACRTRSYKFLAWAETFVGNLPPTIGAISLACANLGVDWFKFTEEMSSTCQPVHFHSKQCTFPEFPGCFFCDTNAVPYRIALGFHWACSAFAGFLSFALLAKLILARRVVFDELSSPTTASPAGLLCMALNVVFAGRGAPGMAVVSLASFVHLCLAVWFIYMALAYHIMPEPSWFPNTTGIGISAVKTWLYFPTAGHFLMAVSLTLNLFFFPISLIRVAFNEKISATVGWMQMSAPNVSLYALTIMAQPSFEEENPDVYAFQRVHRMVYMPCMHFFFSLCVIGMIASVTSLVVRWKEFRKLPFSPAHAAFCVPTLSHANAIQAYRASIDSFSELPQHSLFRRTIFVYWMLFLGAGTIVTVWVASKFLYHLPEWTHIDTSGEIEPPAPNETVFYLNNMISTGESLVQPYVSPAILQANETGALVLTHDAHGHQRYVRTRKVTALGFEPMMGIIEMEREREVLLDYVVKNPPRRRHRTLSVPGVDFSYGTKIGTGTGVYGLHSPLVGRGRAITGSPFLSGGSDNLQFQQQEARSQHQRPSM